MSTYFVQGSTMDAIADAINAKTGGSSAMTPAQMVTAIGSISGGGGSPIEVTIVNGVENGNLEAIRNAITAGSGFTNWVAVNKTTTPDSGPWLYSGALLPSFSNGLSVTYRRTTTGNNGNGAWSANGTVPAGTVFDVWEVYYNA